jgi:4-hydroxy-3-methylbut-2-enyl diphosphate reductase
VRLLAGRCEVVPVVGSVNSSNSNRQRGLAEKQGARVYLIDGAGHIYPA